MPGTELFTTPLPRFAHVNQSGKGTSSAPSPNRADQSDLTIGISLPILTGRTFCIILQIANQPGDKISKGAK